MLTHPLTNALLFQIGWFTAVLGAAGGNPLLGLGVAFFLCGIQWANRRTSRREVLAVCFVALFGTAVDTVLRHFAVTDYPGWRPSPWLCPPWISGLWLLYGSTLRRSLSWLERRAWLGVTLGALAGPLSYLGAERLGALVVADSTSSLVALACAWAFAVPFTVWAASHMASPPAQGGSSQRG